MSRVLWWGTTRARILSGGRARRSVGAVVSAVLVAGVALYSPMPAAAASVSAPKGSPGVAVPVSPVAVHSIPSQHSTGKPFKATEVTWPPAGSAALGLARPASKAHAAGAVSTTTAVPVSARAIADAHGSYTGPSTVTVKVLPHSSATALGVSGVVFSATGSSTTPGAVKLGLDYRGFAQQDGGNFGERLKLVELPACALTTPAVAACRKQTPVASVNDAKAQSVTASVLLGGASGEATATADSVTVSPVGAASTASNDSVMVLAATTDSGSNGSAGGSYSATSLKPSASWNEGGDSGSFDYTYPLTVPGSSSSLTPSLALSYSSESVDGQTAVTNAQSSWAGDGWSTPDSFVEQTFATCSDNPENVTPAPTNSDMCYDGPILTLSLGGSSTSLVCNAAETSCTPQNDDGSVVTHVTGANNGSGTYNTDYWKITERSGNTYYFGLNQLPGYASGDQTTNSVDSEPVYSSASGDPCYNATFSSAVCTMAYRWHLDYVTNLTGQAMAYYYTQTTNQYGENSGAKDVSYVRDSYLNEIDYGFAAGGAYGKVPDEVKFVPAANGRCVQTSCTSLSSSSMTSTLAATDDPDVPFDLLCGAPYAETTCTSYGPSFFSTSALASIETYQYSTTTSAYEPVDLYSLTQTEPTTGDTTNSTLWLSGIQHTGEDTSSASTSGISMPSETFQGVDLPNRVDTTNFPGLYRYRISQINSELGAQTNITYSAPDACTTAYVQAQTASTAENNTNSCYPVYWQPVGYTSQIMDWFESYAVKQVLVADTTGGSLTQETDYAYGTGAQGAAWRYDDNEVVKAKYRTYGQFRGYGTVTTYNGAVANNPQTEQVDTYYRGMDGNWSIASNGTVSATVKDSLGGLHTDSDALAGDVLESQQYLGAGGPVDNATITSYWVSGAVQTRTRSGLPDLTARMTGTAEIWKSQADTDGGVSTSTVTEIDTSYDATTTDANFGLATYSYSHTVPANTSYDKCTRTTYAPANTGLNLVGLVSSTETDVVACTGFTEGSIASVPSGFNTLGAPTITSQSQVASANETFYDVLSPFPTGFPQTTVPTTGEATMVRKARSGTPGSFVWQTESQSTYDSYGRVIASYDPNGNETTTSYTMDAVGLTTGQTVTAPATTYTVPGTTTTTTTQHVTNERLDPTRGLVLTATDENGLVTTENYDALGRVLNVWEHNRATTSSPTLEYTYTVSNTKPSGVTTQTLNDAGAYNTSVAIDDSLGRDRQTQTPTPQGGRLLTDTLYDSRGWVLKKNNAYWDPTTTPAMPTGALPGAADNAVPNQDDYVYDGLGRTVQDLSENDAVVKSTTTTVYNGDATTVIPPSGGTVKTTQTDPLGRTSALVEYTTNPTLTTPSNTFTGTWYITPAADSSITTSYGYDAADNQTQIKDQAGDIWNSSYDLLGEKTSSTDPDAGTSTMSYYPDGKLKETQDALKNYVSFTYDQLGRKTGEYNVAASAQSPYVSSTSAGNQMAAWIYDNANGVSGVTDAIGQTTTTIAYSGGNPYTEQSKGFNNFGESLGTSITIPAAQGTTLGKTWTFTNTYTATTGLLFSSAFPAGGGLPLETTTPTYTAGLYLPSGLGSTLAGYDNGTTYTAYSQVQSTVLGNGTNDATITDTYDPHTGQLTDQAVTRNKTTPAAVDDTAYTYNPAGLLTRETETRLGATAAAETQCFTYTTQAQLSQAWTATDSCASIPSSSNHTTVGDTLSSASAYDETWTYNASSGTQASETSYNPVAETTSTTTDTYGNSTQPATLTKAAATSGTPNTYGYNADGQQNARSTSLGSQTLAWNNDGTLAKVTNTTSSTVSNYIYDADGNLLLQEDPGTTTLYLPGEQITYNTTAATSTGDRYYALPGGATAVRTGSGTNYKFELTSDQHATNTLYFDSTCQMPTWRQQDPYGNVRGAAVTWVDNRGFLNKINDTTTGLTDIGARWYDPTTGSFISLDPVLETTDPTQLGGYDYAGNDPVSSSDPTGKRDCLDSCGSEADQQYAKGLNKKSHDEQQAYAKEQQSKCTASGNKWANGQCEAPPAGGPLSKGGGSSSYGSNCYYLSGSLQECGAQNTLANGLDASSTGISEALKFFLGYGSQNVEFSLDSPFGQLLVHDPNIQDAYAQIETMLANGSDIEDLTINHNYSDTPPGKKIGPDIAGVLSAGAGGSDPADGFLGSYGLTYTIISQSGGSAKVQFSVSNDTDMQSLTHGTQVRDIGPVMSWYDGLPDQNESQLGSRMPMASITQEMTWTDTIEAPMLAENT